MNSLLYTATIDPGKTPQVAFSDPDGRLEHYITAFIMWARSGLFPQIVVGENSGNYRRFDCFKEIASAHKINLEIIGTDDNSGSWTYGKGHGEARILENVLASSKLLRNAEEIWKCTGRLFVANAEDLIRTHRGYKMVMRWEDTRFWKYDKEVFYESLVPAHRTIHDARGTSIEIAYERALGPLRLNGRASFFAVDPAYVGQDAGSGNWHRKFPPEIVAEARKHLTVRT